MVITIYGKTFNAGFNPYIKELFEKLNQHNVKVIVHKSFLEFIRNKADIDIQAAGIFENHNDIKDDVDFMISIGGDGTFLETIPFLRNYNIPIIGLNSGRLGFLANIARGEISSALDAIFERRYDIESRTLIRLDSDINVFGDLNFALNEITIQKKNSSMITIEVYLNDEFLNYKFDFKFQ